LALTAFFVLKNFYRYSTAFGKKLAINHPSFSEDTRKTSHTQDMRIIWN